MNIPGKRRRKKEERDNAKVPIKEENSEFHHKIRKIRENR